MSSCILTSSEDEEGIVCGAEGRESGSCDCDDCRGEFKLLLSGNDDGDDLCKNEFERLSLILDCLLCVGCNEGKVVELMLIISSIVEPASLSDCCCPPNGCLSYAGAGSFGVINCMEGTRLKGSSAIDNVLVNGEDGVDVASSNDGNWSPLS